MDQEPSMNAAPRAAAELAASAIAGFAAFLAPLVIVPPPTLMPSPLFPLVRTAVEDPRISSFAGLAVVGVLGGVFGRSSWILLGLIAMGVFPLCSLAEIAKDSSSHNLLPFEFVMYGIFSLPAVIGAGVGRLIRRALHRPATAS
jgi:hypothetical protein